MNDIYYTPIDGFTLRYIQEQDIPELLELIKELAVYEKLLDKVVATPEVLKDSIFNRKVVTVIMGDFQNKPAGYALYFHNFSTFLGRPGIYIEDLYIKPELRGKGLGKALLGFIIEQAKLNNCGRVEWSCLDWNEPSIRFYKKMGAKSLREWIIFRLSGEELDSFTYDESMHKAR